MSSNASAALMSCCILTEEDFTAICGTDPDAPDMLAELLLQSDMFQTTNFEGVGDGYIGKTYAHRFDDGADEPIPTSELSTLSAFDGRKYTLDRLIRLRATIRDENALVVLDRVVLFCTISETWALRLIPCYG